MLKETERIESEGAGTNELIWLFSRLVAGKQSKNVSKEKCGKEQRRSRFLLVLFSAIRAVTTVLRCRAIVSNCSTSTEALICRNREAFGCLQRAKIIKFKVLGG